MRPILRKLRGALGTAVTWAVGWAVSGLVLFSLPLWLWGNRGFFWDTLRPLTVLAAFSGFTIGMVFSVVLGTVHRRRRLSELRPLRMALWGAGAGVLVPLALIGIGAAGGVGVRPEAVAAVLLCLGGLGAVTAGGTIKLAQAADRELPDSGRDGRLGPGQ